MRWYTLFPKDQRYNNWILYSEEPEPDLRIAVRAIYAASACASCGKVDEYASIRSRIDDNVAIRATTDVVGTSDGFICLSLRVVDIMGNAGIHGLDLIRLPCKRYLVGIPTVVALTDAATSGMDFIDKCGGCGRFRETTGWPGMLAMEVPQDPMQIVTSSLPSESTLGRRTMLTISEPVVAIFKKARLTGISYVELG